MRLIPNMLFLRGARLTEASIHSRHRYVGGTKRVTLNDEHTLFSPFKTKSAFRNVKSGAPGSARTSQARHLDHHPHFERSPVRHTPVPTPFVVVVVFVFVVERLGDERVGRRSRSRLHGPRERRLSCQWRAHFDDAGVRGLHADWHLFFGRR